MQKARLDIYLYEWKNAGYSVGSRLQATQVNDSIIREVKTLKKNKILNFTYYQVTKDDIRKESVA